jgi:UDP-N-acetylmuramoylalanine--D-glutamate ligase
MSTNDPLLPGQPPAAPSEAGAGAPAISAAQAAAEFVAQIFAEVAAPGSTPVEAPTVAQDVPPSALERPEPVGRPGEGMEPLAEQNILILGLGASGLAMARWCVRCGARVTVADTRQAPPQLAALRHELPQVRFVAGEFGAHLVEGHGLHAVYRSPGLSPASVAPVFAAASAMGISTGG